MIDIVPIDTLSEAVDASEPLANAPPALPSKLAPSNNDTSKDLGCLNARVMIFLVVVGRRYSDEFMSRRVSENPFGTYRIHAGID
jgi:hypothetical protein